MRILLLAAAFPPEVRSSSHLMYELAEDLAGRGHGVGVVTSRPRYNLAAPAPPAGSGVQLEQMGGVLAAHWLGRRWRTPFVFNVQDLFPQNAIDLGALRNPLLVAFFRALERYIYRRAAAIALHSEGNAASLRRDGVEAAKLRAIPNWVDTHLHRPEAGATENRFRRELGLEDRFTVLFAGVMGYA